MSPILKNLKLVFTNSTEESIANTAWTNIKMFYMFQTRQSTDVEVIQFEDHNPIFSMDWAFLEWIAPYMERLGYRWSLNDVRSFRRI